MVEVLTIGTVFIELDDRGRMITSPPLKVKAESRECNSISGLTGFALTTIGKRTKNSSWTYADVAAKSRKEGDLVWMSAKNRMTVRSVDTESTSWSPEVSAFPSYYQYLPEMWNQHV